MLTAASSWRECTGCFCLASPFNLAFTWDTEITLHLNTCPVTCTRNVASSESRRSSMSAYPFRRIGGWATSTGGVQRGVSLNIEPNNLGGANISRLFRNGLYREAAAL